MLKVQKGITSLNLYTGNWQVGLFHDILGGVKGKFLGHVMWWDRSCDFPALTCHWRLLNELHFSLARARIPEGPSCGQSSMKGAAPLSQAEARGHLRRTLQRAGTSERRDDKSVGPLEGWFLRFQRSATETEFVFLKNVLEFRSRSHGVRKKWQIWSDAIVIFGCVLCADYGPLNVWEMHLESYRAPCDFKAK